jgi:hypothetical protein
MMRYVSRVLFGTVAALAAVAITQVAAFAAPASVHDSVSGAEYSATATEGRFAGYATGTLPGVWNVDVFHTPLSGSGATITGGTFTIVGGQFVSGRFDNGGAITQTSGFSGCTNQTYNVRDTLNNGKGSFNATLTHYRFASGSSCITYGASVSGTVDLGS